MQDGEFEWDDAKAAANVVAHGISFEVARRAFDDTFGIARDDRREAYREDRSMFLGVVGNRLLAVVYTMRGERVRIISARPAEPREKRWYHEENN